MARSRKSKSPSRTAPTAATAARSAPSWHRALPAFFHTLAFPLWAYLLGSGAGFVSAICAEEFGWPSEAACASIGGLRLGFFGALFYLLGSLAGLAQLHASQATAAGEGKAKAD